MEPDGSAEYKYGMPYSEFIEMFEGTWKSDNYGEKYGGSAYEEKDVTIVLVRELTSEGLNLMHVGGEPLLSGTEGAEFGFVFAE